MGTIRPRRPEPLGPFLPMRTLSLWAPYLGPREAQELGAGGVGEGPPRPSFDPSLVPLGGSAAELRPFEFRPKSPV